MKFQKTNNKALSISGYNPENLEKVGITAEKVHLLQFNTLHQMAAYVKSIKNIKTKRTSSHGNDTDWSGTATFNDALDLILYPYKEPPVDIKEKVESIEHKVRNNLQKKGLLTDWIAEDYHYDVEGIEIDIAKLIEGDPECYLKPNKKYKDHFYDLRINIAVNCGNSVDNIIEAFCKALAVIVALEKRGHKIRLYVTSISKNITYDGAASMIDVLIKNYDSPVNIKMLARVIYPSFLRRIIFKIEEVEFGDELSGAYGQAVNQLEGVITIDSILSEEALLNHIVEKYVAP